jgi:anti-sigma factor RsiW
MTEPVTDADLQAYIDGQLDTPSRIEVEAWLQHRPEIAAEVMEGLRLRDEVRLFMHEEARAAPATVGLARQLTRQLGRRRLVLQGRRWAAAVVLIGAGWLAHAELGLLVDEVAAAHHAPAVADAAANALAVMRLKLAAGQVEEAELVSVVTRETGDPLPVPRLGQGLQRVGGDLVPWNGGTAVVELYRTAAGDLVSLFAAEAGSFAVTSPQVAAVAGGAAVYWQAGPFAYALTGALPDARLLDIAGHAAPRPWTGFDFSLPIEGATHG